MKHIARPIALAAACVGLWVVPMVMGPPDNPVLTALWGGGLFLHRHLFTALLPAFLLAGATAVFLDRRAVVAYLGSDTYAPLAYGISAVASSVMAFCSCMVLPVFAGIYRRGAGLGPAVTFLYCGPAINVLALVLTVSVLGAELGLVRAGAAIVLGVLVGLLMSTLSRADRESAAAAESGEEGAPMWRGIVVLALLVAASLSGNWARTGEIRATAICCPDGNTYYRVEGQLVDRGRHNLSFRDSKGRIQHVPTRNVVALERDWSGPGTGPYGFLPWALLGGTLAGLAVAIPRWYDLSALRQWGTETAGFINRLLPLLLAGIAGSALLFGYRGEEGLVPSGWIEWAVGGNSIGSLFAASVAGAGMYFATLTEIPIVQALMGAGMGHGAALAMLLAGPVVSLPALLVVRNVLGTVRTAVYVALVVLTAVGAGAAYSFVL